MICAVTSVCSATVERVIADLLERPRRHANHRLFDRVPLRLQGIDDIDVGHRAEEPPVHAGLLRDLHRHALELGAALLRLRELLGRGLLELGALLLEQLQVLGRGALRLALRDQEVAREARA